jgi:hypothetical protein
MSRALYRAQSPATATKPGQTEARPSTSAAGSRWAGSGNRYPVLADLVRAQLFQQRLSRDGNPVSRAVARGELRPGVDSSLVPRVAVPVINANVMLTRGRLSESFLPGLVDNILIPLLTAEPKTRPHPPSCCPARWRRRGGISPGAQPSRGVPIREVLLRCEHLLRRSRPVRGPLPVPGGVLVDHCRGRLDAGPAVAEQRSQQRQQPVPAGQRAELAGAHPRTVWPARTWCRSTRIRPRSTPRGWR